MLTGSTLVRVRPSPGGGWDVREPGNARALSHADEKGKAILRARASMLNGGVVQVLDDGGFLLETYAVPHPRDRPWWYVPPRPLSWVFGAAFFLQGVLGVTERGVGEVRFWLGAAVGLMGGFYLVLVAVSRRRDHHLLESERLPTEDEVGTGQE